MSDPDGKICDKYGVIKDKKLYGKVYKGIDRSTFIIDEKGKVTHALRGIKVKGHIRKLLEILNG